MILQDLLGRVRFQIGDPPMTFRTTALGDGKTVWYDLPKQEVNRAAVLGVAVVSGATETFLLDYTLATPWNATTPYQPNMPNGASQVTYNTSFFTCIAPVTGIAPTPGGSIYWRDDTAISFALDTVNGQVFMTNPVPLNGTLIISGQAWSLFSDFELQQIALDSVRQHVYAQEIEERYLDARGFIDYREEVKSLYNLPAIEEPLVEMLTTINCFWALANDAASDSNVQTAEGTVVDRATRYRQIMEQIAALTARYQDYCGQLNVGLYRAETLQLRRTSYTTGRLVPLFRGREYDDHRWPTRLIPPVDHRNDDPSGIPSPLWYGNWGV